MSAFTAISAPALQAKQCFTTRRHSCRVSAPAKTALVCKAQAKELADVLKSKIAATSAAALLALSPLTGAALASEYDVINVPTPTRNYVIDDAKVLYGGTKKSLNDQLSRLETETGYRLEVATLRKLEFENDAFGFGDKLIERWYPTVEQGTNKGVLLVVTTAKDGALTGGPGFLKAVGDDIIDSVVSDNIPIFTEQEKYNETVTSSVARIEAVLTGKPDPGAPQRKDTTRKRTYKTREEVDKNKNVSIAVFASLLLIAVVVPMLQYWGYTSEE